MDPQHLQFRQIFGNPEGWWGSGRIVLKWTAILDVAPYEPIMTSVDLEIPNNFNILKSYCKVTVNDSVFRVYP